MASKDLSKELNEMMKIYSSKYYSKGMAIAAAPPDTPYWTPSGPSYFPPSISPPIVPPIGTYPSVMPLKSPGFIMVELTLEDIKKLQELGIIIDRVENGVGHSLRFVDPPVEELQDEEEYYLSDAYEEDWTREHPCES